MDSDDENQFNLEYDDEGINDEDEDQEDLEDTEQEGTLGMQSYVMTHDTDNESDIDQSYQQIATDSES